MYDVLFFLVTHAVKRRSGQSEITMCRCRFPAPQGSIYVPPLHWRVINAARWFSWEGPAPWLPGAYPPKTGLERGCCGSSAADFHGPGRSPEHLIRALAPFKVSGSSMAALLTKLRVGRWVFPFRAQTTNHTGHARIPRACRSKFKDQNVFCCHYRVTTQILILEAILNFNWCWHTLGNRRRI